MLPLVSEPQGTPVRDDAAQWLTAVPLTSQRAFECRSTHALGNASRYTDPRVEIVRRKAVLEALAVVRRGLGECVPPPDAADAALDIWAVQPHGPRWPLYWLIWEEPPPRIHKISHVVSVSKDELVDNQAFGAWIDAELLGGLLPLHTAPRSGVQYGVHGAVQALPEARPSVRTRTRARLAATLRRLADRVHADPDDKEDDW